METCRLYLITPPDIDLETFVPKLEAVLDVGDVACLQLRLKQVEDEFIYRAAERLLPICHARSVPLIVNDRADIAAEVGADGVHIGADDGNYKDVRATVGERATVGVSCYDSRHLAIEAAALGADYVAFGAFFPTKTKVARGQADIRLLKWWHTLMVIPCVAIGGINSHNCAPLVASGADFLAVIDAIWHHPDGADAGVKAISKAIAKAGQS